VATTYFKTHHISKGETIAQSLKDRFDYGRNPDKTQDGELVRAYECDHKTAEEEFTLAKSQYLAITGRTQKKDADILCYQIRQSFKRGEVDAETALKIGYDLGMRWTKGNHAFFVVSHIDRPHPHIHVYYNSTTLDCTRKFRDFLGSARAVRRLSDRICLENNLSVVRNPKLKSKGKFKHYGEWRGNDKPPTFQEQLKFAIDAALTETPKDFDEFLSAMTAAGFEHKWGRGGVLSFRTDGQKNFTRLRSTTLGAGYGLDDIQNIIAGTVPLAVGRTRRRSVAPKINLIVDIQKKISEGKGAAYERWAKVYNLKQMAAALQYLQEHSLLEYSALEAKANAATDNFHDISGKLKTTESGMKRNAKLKAAIVDYAKTKPTFDEYKRKKYSNKFLAENEAEIKIHREARNVMQEILDGAKLPKMDALKTEWQTLTAAKKSQYTDYRAAQKDMREVVAVKSNIDHLLGIADKANVYKTFANQHLHLVDIF